MIATGGLDELLGDLLDGTALTARLAGRGLDIVAMEPAYVRRKAGHSATVAYRIETGSGQTWGYLHRECDPCRADERLAKALTLRPRPSVFGDRVHRLDRSTVCYGLPNDQRLRRLRWFVSGRKLKRSMAPALGGERRISGRRTTVDILRYKPERRLVADVDLVFDDRSRRRVVVRYATAARAGDLAEAAGHLRRFGVAVPQPVAQIEGGRVGVDEHVDGRLLLDAVRIGTIPAGEVAETLTTLHRCPALDGLANRDGATELERALLALDGLAGLAPELCHQAERLGQQLRKRQVAPVRPAAFLHGDLHPKNVIVAPGGVTLIDLDRMAAGPVEIDLGTLLAHAIALEHRRPGWSPTAAAHARTVIECYRSGGGGVDDDALRWHTAVGLVEIALLVTRHVQPGWPLVAESLVDRAAEQLG